MSDCRSLASDAEPAVLSPQQFHDQVERALRAALARDDPEPGLRALTAILTETPTLGVTAPHPADVVRMLVDGVRAALVRSRLEPVDGERLLAELIGFVLAFYPEAVQPPSWALG